jgi:hypothetical protein
MFDVSLLYAQSSPLLHRDSQPGEEKMRILKSVSYALALACLVCLFIPCTALAQDDSPDPLRTNTLTQSTPEWTFVQSSLPNFEATQNNMPAEAFAPARAQASESPVKLGDAAEMNAMIEKSCKLVHSRQS